MAPAQLVEPLPDVASAGVGAPPRSTLLNTGTAIAVARAVAPRLHPSLTSDDAVVGRPRLTRRDAAMLAPNSASRSPAVISLIAIG